jgi:hypothetical protein
LPCVTKTSEAFASKVEKAPTAGVIVPELHLRKDTPENSNDSTTATELDDPIATFPVALIVALLIHTLDISKQHCRQCAGQCQFLRRSDCAL